MRSARDEYTLAAKRETLNHGAPSVTDVGSEMEGV
jgi:hypothetical protein